jgi:putative DNA primase/helicase
VKLPYSPEAKSSVWRRFIESIFQGDQELIDFVQRLMGYCCTGSVEEQVLPILCGVGANGKSTFVGTIQRILGDFAITAPVGLLTQQRYAGHEEMFAELRGRRLVVSNEFEASCSLAEQRIKKLTGGDILTARELYGQRFYFEPMHKNLLVTNQTPRIAVSDHAIRRRVLMIPFEVIILKRDQDPSLLRCLVEEDGEAVLAWMVEGAVAWSKEGLGTSKAVVAATQQYHEDQNRIGKFLAEATVRAPNERCKVGALYEQWRAWCVRSGESPGREGAFRSSLEDQGLIIRPVSNVQFVLGIKLSGKELTVESN